MYRFMNIKKYRARFADGHSCTVYHSNMHFAKIRACELHSLCGYDNCDIIEIRRI